MLRHQFVVSGSNSTPPPLPFCAQYIGRMYSSALASKRAIPSRASPSQVSVSTTGFSLKLTADWLIRAQWRSRSGATPSKARAPSKTVEPSHAACVRGPMIGTLPSCQAPSKKVQVCEKLTGFTTSTMNCHPRRGLPAPHPMPSLLSEFPKDFLAEGTTNNHRFTIEQWPDTFRYRSRYAPRSPGKTPALDDVGGLAGRLVR